MRRKLLSLFFAAAIVVVTLSGCSNPWGSQSQQGKTAPAGSQDTSTGEITFPLAEQVEITIATEDGTVASLADDLPIWKELQRRTNVKINWDVTAPAQYVDAMKLRISDGDDLPDVMLLPNGLNLGKLGGDGIIIPLEDYIDRYGENIQSMYGRFPRVKSLTSADGHVYSINTVSENAYLMPYSFVIRKDWLDRLGLDEPETIDDWMTVLRAFRDEDADGDGDPNNEIPFSAGGHVWYTTFWAHAWDLHLFYSDGWYPDANGQMQYEFISDNAREFFTWMNNFYQEGLLDPGFLDLESETALYEKVARNEVGAFTVHPSQIPTIEAALHANGVEDAKLVPLVPPAGPYAQMIEVQGDMEVNGYVITSNCEHPEVVVALIDYLMSDEGTELINFGIEGKTYTKKTDGSYSFTKLVTANPDGMTAIDVLSSYGCQMGLPHIMSEKRGEAMLFEYDDDMRELFVAVSVKTRPYARSGLVLPPATEEESKVIADISDAVTNYTWEMTGKFIIGTEDINEKWDDFVIHVEELGVDDILVVKQAQYDRMQK